MEYEKKVEQPTIKQLLGASGEADREYGIINEYEGFIKRRAYDYLMVGFVTDTDQVEAQREARFEEYLDKIEADFAQYRVDVKKWNQDHADSTNPERWQTQKLKPNSNIYIRRTDLPPKQVSERAIITSPAINHEPSRDEIKAISSEGIEAYFNHALYDSYNLLTEHLNSIVGELPTAPHEPSKDGVRTRQQLIDEYKRVVSRMQAIEEIHTERNPVDTADNLAYLQTELPGHTPPITEKIYIVQSLGKISASHSQAE